MTGSLVPAIENPLPVKVAELTVAAAVPRAVSVSVFVKVLFKFTLPNAREVALKLSCDEAPVPLRLTVLILPLEELLEILSVPLAVLATVGWKLT